MTTKKSLRWDMKPHVKRHVGYKVSLNLINFVDGKTTQGKSAAGSRESAITDEASLGCSVCWRMSVPLPRSSSVRLIKVMRNNESRTDLDYTDLTWSRRETGTESFRPAFRYIGDWNKLTIWAICRLFCKKAELSYCNCYQYNLSPELN